MKTETNATNMREIALNKTDITVRIQQILERVEATANVGLFRVDVETSAREATVQHGYMMGDYASTTPLGTAIVDRLALLGFNAQYKTEGEAGYGNKNAKLSVDWVSEPKEAK